jgi:hypothetical protein
MGLDIRLPIGMLFTIYGIMLIFFGLFSKPALYAQSLGINVNLNWGVVLLIFGAIMFFLGARAMFFAPHPAETPDAEGREQRH